MKILEHKLIIEQEDNYLGITYGENKIVFNIDNYRLIDALTNALKDLGLEKDDNLRVTGIENSIELLQNQNKNLKGLVSQYSELTDKLNKLVEKLLFGDK